MHPQGDPNETANRREKREGDKNVTAPSESGASKRSKESHSTVQKDADTKLIKDLRSGGVEVLSKLLTEGLDLNSVVRGYGLLARYNDLDPQRGTALHWASHFENVKAIKVLMNAGSNVEADDPSGSKPLHWACAARKAKGVSRLLKAGANVDATGYLSMTPLHWASMSGNVGAMRILVAAGANLEAPGRNGMKPLHFAAEHEYWVEPVRILVDAGANFECLDNSRSTPLHYACARRSKGARILVEAGANVEAVDDNGETPLQYAVDGGDSYDTETWKLLVDSGANIDVIDADGRTPIHRWLKRFDWSDVRVLVEAGASLEIADKHGKTPLHYTAHHRWEKAARVLVEAGAMLDTADERGRTTLHSAILNRALSVARYLSDAGASPRTAETTGETPLHCAALYAVRDLVEAFIKAGANVQALNEDGQTPLHYAAESGEEGIAQLLVNAGANVEARDGDGRTPLHWAAECNKAEVVAVLVNAGADVKVRDNEGWTAAEIASGGQSSDVAHLLNENMAEGIVGSEQGPSAALNATSAQQTHSVEEVSAPDGERTSTESHVGTSRFSVYRFEVKSGLRLQGQPHLQSATFFYGTPYDFLQESDDREVNFIDCDAPTTEEPKNPRDAVMRLSVGAIVADKYRIVSRRIACKGYMRTAVEIDTHNPVSLRFYEDLELMKKHASILEGYKNFSWACKCVETISRDGMLPACNVLQGSLQTLEDRLRTPTISTESKLEMLGSLANALEGLHEQGYVHQGVCPQSVAFCTEDHTCRFLYLDWMTSVDRQPGIEWTSHYAAPELLSVWGLCKLFHQPYQTAADMWAYGVIAYEILTGGRIYEREFWCGESIIEELEYDGVVRILNSVRNKKHRHFIKKFLNLDPKQRQTATAARKSSLLRSIAGTAIGGTISSSTAD